MTAFYEWFAQLAETQGHEESGPGVAAGVQEGHGE